jgi:hypothetical protein
VAPGASAFLMLSLFIGLVTVDLALPFLLVFLRLDLYLFITDRHFDLSFRQGESEILKTLFHLLQEA